jgi:hypothetical protein
MVFKGTHRKMEVSAIHLRNCFHLSRRGIRFLAPVRPFRASVFVANYPFKPLVPLPGEREATGGNEEEARKATRKVKGGVKRALIFHLFQMEFLSRRWWRDVFIGHISTLTFPCIRTTVSACTVSTKTYFQTAFCLCAKMPFYANRPPATISLSLASPSHFLLSFLRPFSSSAFEVRFLKNSRNWRRMAKEPP